MRTCQLPRPLVSENHSPDLQFSPVNTDVFHGGSSILDLLYLDYWLTTWTVKDISNWITSLVCVLELRYHHNDGVSVTITVCFMIVFGKPVATK